MMQLLMCILDVCENAQVLVPPPISHLLDLQIAKVHSNRTTVDTVSANVEYLAGAL